jgi:RNA polymerase sigma factor for flagellar operon FliA
MHATVLADRDAAILSLAPLVRKLARRVASRVASTVVDVDDLESAGWMAVIRAVDVFAPSFGVPIEGYAGRVVLGAMYNELRRVDPVSERDRRTMRLGKRAIHELQHELGRAPSSAEIEARCPGYRRALGRCARLEVSYDATFRSAEGTVLRPVDVLPGSDDVAGTVIAAEERVELQGAIAGLDERRRTVISQHYFERRNLNSVAQDLDVSPQRASQLHLTALEQLQARIAAFTSASAR